MSIKLLSATPLVGNTACFENSETGENQGSIIWQEPVLQDGIYSITFWGSNVQGEEIPTTTIEVEATSEPINPTKVFWWIADKLKKTICPTCI